MIDLSTKTILVVDDEPDVRTFFETALIDAGFTVKTAADGGQAVEILKQEKPALISLDLVMPRKSGVKLFHELRRNKAWAGIPVLVVTAHARDEMGGADLGAILKDASMSGPGVYLEKPVTARNYVKSIKKILKIEDIDAGEDTVALKEQLSEQLKNTDTETLRKLLDLLKRD